MLCLCVCLSVHSGHEECVNGGTAGKAAQTKDNSSGLGMYCVTVCHCVTVSLGLRRCSEGLC